MNYNVAIKYFKKLRKYIKSHYKCKVYLVGSLKRNKQDANDIDILISSRKKDILTKIKIPKTKELDNGKIRKKLSTKLKHERIKIDLFYTHPKDLSFALLHHIGNKYFNIRTRAHAKKQGYLLNQYGLYKVSNGKKIKHKFKSEREILRYLGITYKSPSKRED